MEWLQTHFTVAEYSETLVQRGEKNADNSQMVTLAWCWWSRSWCGWWDCHHCMSCSCVTEQQTNELDTEQWLNFAWIHRTLWKWYYHLNIVWSISSRLSLPGVAADRRGQIRCNGFRQEGAVQVILSPVKTTILDCNPYGFWVYLLAKSSKRFVLRRGGSGRGWRFSAVPEKAKGE